MSSGLRGLRKLSGALSAGLVDSAFSSLATFIAGLSAQRLALDDLGVYSLFFFGFVLAAVAPAQLLLVPAEVAVLGATIQQQSFALRTTVKMAAPIALAAAGIMAGGVALAAPIVRPGIELATLVPLALSAAAFTFLSPLQDHLRRIAHQTNRSYVAAGMSTLQVASVIAAVVAMIRLGVAPVWIPFGSLALANVVSGAVGYHVLVRGMYPRRMPLLKRHLLMRSGGWLLLSGSLDQLFGLLGAFALAAIAGAGAAGHNEAVRQLGQPMAVVAVGVTTVARPHSMRAGHARDRDLARRISTAYLAALGGLGALYALAIGISWPFNPLPELLPKAYDQPGLLVAAIIALTINQFSSVFRNELVGGGLERNLAPISVTAGGSYLLGILALAPVLGAFAIPVATVLQRPGEFLVYRRALRRLYGPEATPAPDPPLELVVDGRAEVATP
ncbi:MAG: hypothetical protein ACKVWR_15210 [Acidimicrobiales bacterium]